MTITLPATFFFFKQKTAYEITASDWSSDVCSSDLDEGEQHCPRPHDRERLARVYAALLAHHAERLVQRVHAEQSRHTRDRDVQKMLEVIVGAGDEKERRDRHERGEQHGRERQRAEHQHGHLEQAQPRPDENLHYEERGKAHRERREEQKWQLEACRQRLCRTRIGAGDETEEPGQSDDGDDGVSQLAAKGDTLDDFVEESLSVAEQRFEEVRVVRDRLVRGHASNPGGLRPKLQTY